MQHEIFPAKGAGRFGFLGGSKFGNKQQHISSFHKAVLDQVSLALQGYLLALANQRFCKAPI